MGKRKTQLSDYSDDENKLTKKKTPKKNNERKFTKDSELEEGEVTDSDSSDLSPGEFDDGYDSDLMGNGEDRLRLAQMTEKEREQEIFRRVEARETMRTRFNIEKKLRMEQRREQKKQRLLLEENIESPLTMNAGDRVLEKKKSVEESRKSSKKHFSSNAQKTRREDLREFDEKENRCKEVQSTNVNRDSTSVDDALNPARMYKTKLKASDVYSDDSDSSSDEEIVKKPKQKKKQLSPSNSSGPGSESDSDSRVRSSNTKVQYISTKAQLNQMKLSRHKLERFVCFPFFKRIAVGCFVKVMIATNKSRSVYKICEIIDVCETDETYQVGEIQTNKSLRLKHGTQERNFRLEFVSNTEFLDRDFVKWRDTCTLQGVKMPTVERMESKVKDIKEAMFFELTVEDIERIVSEKERFKNIRYDLSMKRAHLLNECDSARAAGDSVRAGELQDELNELEERAEKLNQFRTSTISSINYINDRNRRKNVEKREKDVLVELKANTEPKFDDSFVRRQTNADVTEKMQNTTTEFEESFESAEIIDSGAATPTLNEWSDEEIIDSSMTKMNLQNLDNGISSRSIYRHFN